MEWKQQQPTKSIAFRDLPADITENVLASKLNDLQANFDDIRFIPKKGPYGKAQAFIDFISVAAAKEWMEQQQGVISLGDTHTTGMLYSVSLAAKESEPMWECICGALNVERRLRCFKCERAQPPVQGTHGGNRGNPEQLHWQLEQDRDRVYPSRFREELNRPWAGDAPFRSPGKLYRPGEVLRGPPGDLLGPRDELRLPPSDRYLPWSGLPVVGNPYRPPDDLDSPYRWDGGPYDLREGAYRPRDEPFRGREAFLDDREWEMRERVRREHEMVRREMMEREMRGETGRKREMREQIGRDREGREQTGRDRETREQLGKDRETKEQLGRDQEIREQTGREREMRERLGKEQAAYQRRADVYRDAPVRDRYVKGIERHQSSDGSPELAKNETNPYVQSSDRQHVSGLYEESAKHRQREDRRLDRNSNRNSHQERPSRESRRGDNIPSRTRHGSPHDRESRKEKDTSSESVNKYPVFGPSSQLSAKKIEYEKQKRKEIIASLRQGGGSSSLLTGRRHRDSDPIPDKTEERPRDSRTSEPERERGEPNDRPAVKKSNESSAPEVDDGSNQIGSKPSDTVLLRGLDGLSDESKILQALAEITSLEPTNCYVMRNLSTNVSLGYGFMEFDSVSNAKKIVDYFNSQQPFEVDGKMLIVDSAKNSYKTILAEVHLAREKEQAEANAASLKRQLYEQEQQAKQKKLELQRQKQLELEQEQSRKQAEAQKEMQRAKLEQMAKEQAEKDKFAATFGVEIYSGHKYEQDTGLYTDKGQFIPERCCFVGHSMANNLDLRIFDDKEIVPNGKIDDLVTAAVKLFDNSTLKSYRICCYLFFGITDLLDVKQSQGYREVVLRTGGDTLLLSKIDWAVKTMKMKGVMVVLCTFPPMSFAKHNQFLLKNGLTGKLEHKSEYSEMQTKLNEQVSTINKRIEELNCDSGVVTCQLSAKLFVQERGRYILKDIYLRDGLHPTNQGATLLNVELAQNLRKSKQGKRSPEWLKKSHQVKSTGKISFGIKVKKEEPTILPAGRGFDAPNDGQDLGVDSYPQKQSKANEFASVKDASILHEVRPSQRRSGSPISRKRSRSPGNGIKFSSGFNKSFDSMNKGNFYERAVKYTKDTSLASQSLSQPAAKLDRQAMPQHVQANERSQLQDGENAECNNRSRSRSRSLGQSHSRIQDQFRPRDYCRSRSRSRENHYSRFHRRSRSRSQSRRNQEQRNAENRLPVAQRKRNSPEAQWNDPNLNAFKSCFDFPVKKPELHISRRGPHSTSLLGEKPVDPFDRASTIRETKEHHEPNKSSDALFKLAQEHQALTGNNSYGQVETLSTLQQLSGGDTRSGGLSKALELQKAALSDKMLGCIEDQKSKRVGELEGEMGEFERIVGRINAQARASSYSRREVPGYRHGLASQFQLTADQDEPWNGVSGEAMRELERSRFRVDPARIEDNNQYDRGGIGGWQEIQKTRGGYGGYE